MPSKGAKTAPGRNARRRRSRLRSGRVQRRVDREREARCTRGSGRENQWPGRGVPTRDSRASRTGGPCHRRLARLAEGAREEISISRPREIVDRTRAALTTPRLADALPLTMVPPYVSVHRRSTGNRGTNVQRNLRAMYRVRVCNPD